MSLAFIKTPALCLNVRPFSKTSHMVTWLTPIYGRIVTPIKGAQRPKSAFLGKYDIGYTCEIVLYPRERNGVHNIRECSPLIFREDLRTHWRAATAANYACDLTLRAAQPHLPNEELFETLTQLLDLLPTMNRHEHSLALLWFESRLLQSVGNAPDFNFCPQCSHEEQSFSLEEGRFYCSHRPTRLYRPPSLRLHSDIAELFTYFNQCSIETMLSDTKASSRIDDLGRPEPFPGIFGLRRFLGLFLTTHLDLSPGPRRTLLELLI